jgi:hypothetical protein
MYFVRQREPLVQEPLVQEPVKQEPERRVQALKQVEQQPEE